MASGAVTTKHQNLNIRSGPSINTPVIGKLAKGQAIEVRDETVSEGGWTWIRYGGGWICQKDPRYSYNFVNVTPKKEDVTPAPAQPAPAPVTPNYDDMVSGLLGGMNNGDINITGSGTSELNGSGVLYEDEKYDADALDINKNWKVNKNRGMMTKDQLSALDRKSPEFYQNKWGYPAVHRFNTDKQYYEYNYYMDYDAAALSSDLQLIRNDLNIGIEGRDQLFRQYTEYYNRFKLGNPNDALHKTYAHVFFVRPDCNVLERKGTTWVLPSGLENSPEYVYAYHKSPELLKQLVDDAGYNHDFMMYLSNKARNFQTSDESINTDTYGKALTGHKIAYGKTNVESKTAGDFNITYIDDRDLHVYHLHKLWVDYISNVYQGIFDPKMQYIQDRILDYVSDVYYFLCAEDGETIIFWSKYYGVFPVSIPSSQLSWVAGNILSTPEFDVRYQYSFKEDFNPLSLNEFNINSGNTNFNYVPVINHYDYTPNTTWVGAPFIECFNNDRLAPYTLKLRFRKGNM